MSVAEPPSAQSDDETGAWAPACSVARPGQLSLSPRPRRTFPLEIALAGLIAFVAALQPTGALGDAADPTVIGYSQGGRPLTVYHLGAGPQPVLILGGQHGAPEVNTVRLAERLLAYFEENP